MSRDKNGQKNLAKKAKKSPNSSVFISIWAMAYLRSRYMLLWVNSNALVNSKY